MVTFNMTETDTVYTCKYCKRKMLEHGNRVYDYSIIEKDCKYCKKIYYNRNIQYDATIIHIESKNLNHQREQIKKLITIIPQKGCMCDNKRRKFISTIIGCGKSHGCNYDKFKCSMCNKTFRYSSSVYHHIKWSHQRIVLLL